MVCNFLGSFGFERPETYKFSEVVLIGHHICKVTIPFGLVRNQVYLCPGVEIFRQNRFHHNTLSGSVSLFITCGTSCQIDVDHSVGDIEAFLADFCCQLVSASVTQSNMSVVDAIKDFRFFTTSRLDFFLISFREPA